MKSVSLLKDSKPEYLIPDAAIRASPKLAPTVMAGVLISLPVTSATICIHKSFLTPPPTAKIWSIGTSCSSHDL